MAYIRVAKLFDVSVNTVSKLARDAGAACWKYHDDRVQRLKPRYVQADEIWSFTWCKEAHLESGTAKNPPPEAGDTWTWLALDAETRLLISWAVGDRDFETAQFFLKDLDRRIDPGWRFQLTTDGLSAYERAARIAFRDRQVDYAQIVKRPRTGEDLDRDRRYSPPRAVDSYTNTVFGDPDPEHISTSLIERQNLSLRMSVRRYTRLTNAYSKRRLNHARHAALYLVWYNFVDIHKTLRVTPAMEAGLAGEVRDMDWIVELIEMNTPAPAPWGARRRERDARRRREI